MRSPVLAILLAATVFLAGPAVAGDKPLPVPRFASLASDKVYMRQGPTYRHPILWIYRRRGLPVEVIAQYDVWRRVRNSDGTTGWVHSSMVAETRTIVVTAKAPVRAADDPHAKILALAQPGVVTKLQACDADACEIATAGTDGWIEKKSIWGVKTGEVFR